MDSMKHKLDETGFLNILYPLKPLFDETYNFSILGSVQWSIDPMKHPTFWFLDSMKHWLNETIYNLELSWFVVIFVMLYYSFILD